MNPDEDPIKIAQNILDITGTALLKGDFQTFMKCFSLPQRLETFEGLRVMTTEAEMEATFNELYRHLQNNGIVDSVRLCKEAEFRDADTIALMHETRLLSKMKQIHSSYPAMSEMKRVDGVWKLSSGTYAIADDEEFSQILSRKSKRDG